MGVDRAVPAGNEDNGTTADDRTSGGRGCALRRLGLAHTRLANATCGTIRLKLLKIGAQVRVSVRRIKVAMASACPYVSNG